MRRHRRDYEMLSDMNLTNLLDMAFVLLIAFIIASPTMRPGIQIDLPQVVDAPTMNSTDQKSVTIIIKKKDVGNDTDPIYIDSPNTRMTLDDVRLQVIAKKRMNAKLDVVIEADREASYESVARVISMLKAAGIDNVGLPTDVLDSETANKDKAKSAKQ